MPIRKQGFKKQVYGKIVEVENKDIFPAPEDLRGHFNQIPKEPLEKNNLP
jgi:hypothetical protein